MTIRFQCGCGKEHAVEDSRAGSMVMCPACRTKLRVPSKSPEGAPQKPQNNRVCPVCEASLEASVSRCDRCGFDFGDGHDRDAARPKGARFGPAGGKKNRRGAKDEGRQVAITIGAGLGISLLILILSNTGNFFLCLPRIVLACFGTLCHEIGHSLFAWIFGCPSIPAFDFHYGGGVAVTYDRSTFVMLLVYAVFAFLLWCARRNRAAVIALACLLCAHVLFAFTSLHTILILFMGHGGELLFATLFLYRAWTGHSTFHSQERMAYSICGFFLVFSNMLFSYRLFSSAQARYEYGEAKGGGHWMDFDRIAREHLHMQLSTVALFFCLCCILPVVVSYLLFRYESKIAKFAARFTESVEL